ncbi:MAG: transcription antitermination factor NusB [Planctomycetota bacterium]
MTGGASESPRRRDNQRHSARRPTQDSAGNIWERTQRKQESPASSAGAPQNGRQLAYAVLHEFDQTDQFIQDILSRFDSTHSLRSADRALAVDLASGVVRRARTLDAVVQSRMSRARHEVEPDLWRVLRIGAYQLLFANTPDHAAVDSTVELCRDLNRHRWTGFVNGVLRNISRLISGPCSESISSRTVPVESGRWLMLNEDIFPNPETNMVEWIGLAFSLPRFLAERWYSRFAATPNKLMAICMKSISPPDMTLRVNSMLATRSEIIEQLNAVGVSASAGNPENAIRIDGTLRLDALPGYGSGHWCVQDEAAMSASLLLSPQPGEQILDLCAAPGGKTTHLAELSHDQAIITACDVATGRLRRIEENAARLQLHSIRTHLMGKDGNAMPDGPFDAALVDVPCSNTGVLNRRPEARWRCDENSLRELVNLQTRLLLQACERVRPGGRVVYSTCSLEPEENRGVVDAVLSAMKEFRLMAEHLHLPGLPADGAYQAVLQRNGPDQPDR